MAPLPPPPTIIEIIEAMHDLWRPLDPAFAQASGMRIGYPRFIEAPQLFTMPPSTALDPSVPVSKTTYTFTSTLVLPWVEPDTTELQLLALMRGFDESINGAHGDTVEQRIFKNRLGLADFKRGMAQVIGLEPGFWVLNDGKAGGIVYRICDITTEVLIK